MPGAALLDSQSQAAGNRLPGEFEKGVCLIFMDKEQIIDTVKSLVEPGTFAILAAMTKQGDVVLRPIGGQWGSGIIDAIQEIAEKYPSCRMQLFERCNDWKRYFEGIVDREQILPYADFSPETKKAIEEIRQKVLGCRRKELD